MIKLAYNLDYFTPNMLVTVDLEVAVVVEPNTTSFQY